MSSGFWLAFALILCNRCCSHGEGGFFNFKDPRRFYHDPVFLEEETTEKIQSFEDLYEGIPGNFTGDVDLRKLATAMRMQEENAGFDERNQGENKKIKKESTSSMVFLGYERERLAKVSASSPSVTWDHEDQKGWVENFPECGGMYQSPINIRSRFVSIQRAESCLFWSGYRTVRANLQVAIDAHTVEAWASWDGGLGFNPSGPPTISGGPLKGDYILHRLHFHWGYDSSDGSEHAFNSKKYAIEVHLVHYNSKYQNITEAVNSNDSEAVAVVAVLYKVGVSTNLGTLAIVRAISRAIRNEQSVQMVLPLIDFGVRFGANYYSYTGSLTTPGCQQIVRWIIAKKIQPITEMQLRVFRSITYEGKFIYDNFRSTQQLNGREIQYYNTC